MARKQTRRAISIKPETYTQVKAWCDAYKISMSSFVEERVADFFNGVQRTAEDVQRGEGEWTPSKDDCYPGSKQAKERPAPVRHKPLTGGGVHEL